MAKTLSAPAKRALKTISAHLDQQNATLAEALLGDAQAEDLAGIDASILAQAVDATARALARHKAGTSICTVEPLESDTGQKAEAVIVINENMPFLFDSVLGEINDDASRVDLVVHPILDIKHDGSSFEVVDKTRPGLAREKTLRTSVIVTIIAPAGPDRREALKRGIESTLAQVKAAVRDWVPMQARMDEVMADLRDGVTPARKSDVTEALEFLAWLRDNNFTFLGIREYDYVGGEKRGRLERANSPALGILSDPDVRVLRRGDEAVNTTPEIRAFLNSREVLIVTKANVKSVVHRRTYMDYIGVKTYDDKGKLKGEVRIVGLFTSTAYTRSVKRIPYIRSKIAGVVSRSDHEPDSHSGKALLNVLESYPRDELFQIDVPTLARNADAIVALADRPKVRVLSRIDPFDRFVSVVVFVPRDRYSSKVRQMISDYLAETYDGHVSAWYPAFPEGPLARVHIIIGRAKGKTPTPTQASLERDIVALIRTWDDGLASTVAAAPDETVRRSADRYDFPESYKDAVSPEQALSDMAFMVDLSADNPINVDFQPASGGDDSRIALRIYHTENPVALSERVPVLENMGFRVISELTWRIGVREDSGADISSVWVHEMQLQSATGKPVPMDDDGVRYEQGFLSVWRGHFENDGYNALILAASFPVRHANVLRAYGRYLKQAGIPFGQDFLAATLVRHTDLARRIFDLFDARFNPDRAADPNEDTTVTARHIKASITDLLADVPSIDEDRVLRRFVNAVESTLRTNWFQSETDGTAKKALAFKLDPRKLDDLPAPRPYREIFVFAPDVEGVHLRFGPIARGGLRWSDRSEDYRTEVLGLVKAQQVKNAVIVPVGAKGGFFPLKMPTGADRDTMFQAGRSAYMTFISTLLSVTDNLDGETVVAPERVVRHDGDDPYLVVAADKGTATFSDTANGISQAHDFWLDDAFASGGSAGYDHKKMGITARGAWEAVKRHFREMDKDIQSETFTVCGVGDMSGDVFGNGMLLSKQIRLIAAFDHRDIFIDPDPDPASSFRERQRLFDMGRSSWQDYDKRKLSKGGGIFPRSQKLITLSKAAADAIGLDKLKASPTEILTAILKMDAELMWFGGIGTYVRGSGESNGDVGDKANDAIRIAAKELKVKVVGEGANLGMTQRARIEFGLHGGRCNSDAIDNSAGVNSSDVEVNIKIALAPSMRDDTLPRPKRNKLLEAMTDDVAALVLDNNYEQTLTISRVHRRSAANLSLHARLMESLEERGLLDRAVETLPNDEVINERKTAGLGLTRAEIGVLLSYSKIVLLDDLVASSLPDDPWLEKDLMAYFPKRMRDGYRDNIASHRLRREIIATRLANEVVNRGGPAVISRFEDATGMLPSAIVRAHVIARDAYGIEDIHDAIGALDNKISGDRQMVIYEDLSDAQRTAIGQLLRNSGGETPLENAVQRITSAREDLDGDLVAMAPEYLANWIRERQKNYRESGLPDSMARRLACLPVVAMTPDIVTISESCDRSVQDAAKGFFAVTKAFRIGRLEHLAGNLDTEDYFDALAQQRALDTIQQARLAIARAALSGKSDAPDDAVNKWIKGNEVRIGRVQSRISDLTDQGELTVSKLTVAAGLLADLVA